jgi:hypothetical protein
MLSLLDIGGAVATVLMILGPLSVGAHVFG